MKKNFIIIFCLIPYLVFSQSKFYPNSLSNSIWLGVNGGLTYYSGDFSKSNFEFYGKGDFEYFFQSQSKGLFGLKIYSGYGALSGKNSNQLSIGDPSRNSNKFITYFLDAGIGLTYLINFQSIYPFISLGGYSTYWYKVLDQNRSEVYDTKRDISFGVFSEVGMKIKLADGLTLNISGLFSYPNTDELDGRVSNKKDVFVSGLAGFSIYFGGLKDTDLDGVPDRYDLCPNTPPGVKVDEFGCPYKVKIDSDGDGIEDRYDKCPNTPAGVAVDENGCPVDSDGDGVPDYLDRCPGTPANFPVDEKGCPLDSDNDGVLDVFDKCPNTPPGIKVDDYGCPIDSDNDGVPDSIDKCPDTPIGVKVNAQGCPEEQVSTSESEQFFVLQGMTTFEKGSAKLTENAKKELQRIADIIKKFPYSKWRIEGHTDSQGSAEFNKKLSQERANAVKKFLISLGISEKMLVAEGMGENYPIADNKTEEGRQKNRRVVITKIK
jgi:outer membrane protein OmpA-like peptidoglycan-associated protein